MSKRPVKTGSTEESVNTETQQQSAASNSNALPDYLAAALRLSTSFPTGAKTVDRDILGTKGNGTPNGSVIDPIPGIMTLHYVPTMGVSIDRTSAVNRAAYYDFNAIRSKISGNRPYEPSDHMIYRMAVDSMRDMYLYMSRVYKVLRTYSATNLYTPRNMIAAMGLDFDDWNENAATLYQWLLSHQSALRPFPTVPIGNITERHNIFNTYIFHDGDIEASQYYLLNQRCFWSYEVVDEVKGLTPVFPGVTFADWRDKWDEMYGALQSSSDVYIIAADIRRAFEDRVITELTAPGVDDTVEYVKLDPVLTSIMNATIIPHGPQLDLDSFYARFRIEDDGGNIYCAPAVPVLGRPEDAEGENFYVGTARISHLNMVQSNPDPSDILAAIRFKVIPYLSMDGTLAAIDSMGTEVVTSCTISCNPNVGNVGETDYVHDVIRVGSFISACCDTSDGSIFTDSMAAVLTAINSISKFDWHPPIVTPIQYGNVDQDHDSGGITLNGGTTSDMVAIIEDVQNYVPIDENVLKTIHEANLLAEFGF